MTSTFFHSEVHSNKVHISIKLDVKHSNIKREKY